MEKIDSKLLEVIRQEATKAAEKVYASKGTQYGVANVPTHVHNGVDSVSIPPTSIDNFATLPSGLSGVLSRVALGTQVVTQGNTKSGFGAVTNVIQSVFAEMPLVIISGGGNSTPYTLTGTRPAGSTTATLTGNFVGTTGTYATSFFSTEVKQVRFTNGSAAINWSTPLQYSTAGTGISVNGDSTFNGGDAVLGTVVMFCAEESLTPQLWVRARNNTGDEKWWAINFDGGIIGLTG